MAKPDWTQWKTPLSLLKCTNNACLKVSSRWVPDSDVSFQFRQTCPFMVDCECNSCHGKYTICTLCPCARAQHLDVRSISDHIRKCHTEWFDQSRRKRKRTKCKNPASLSLEGPAGRKRSATGHANTDLTAEDAIPDEEGFGFPDMLLDDDVTTPTDMEGADPADVHQEPPEAVNATVEVPPPAPDLVTLVQKQEDIGTGDRKYNAAYFFNESQQEGYGLEYLVGRSNHQLSYLAGELDHDKVMMYARTADLAGDLSRPKRG